MARLDLDDKRIAARSVHAQRRRFSRRLVRERRRQGRLRLRRHRRQLRRAVDAGHGLRAAAPLLRRGERQARRLGPRDRRHGRDHAGDGRGGAGARRRRSAPSAKVAGDPDRRRQRSGRRAGERRGDLRARGRGQRSARSCCSATSCPTSAVAPETRALFTGMKIGLGHVPHERGAERAARFHLPARARTRRTTTAPASSSGRRSTIWSAPISMRA